MDDVQAISAMKASVVSQEAEVKIFNSQRKQAEAVVGKILEGVAESGRALREGVGGRVNVTA